MTLQLLHSHLTGNSDVIRFINQISHNHLRTNMVPINEHCYIVGQCKVVQFDDEESAAL